MVVVPPNRAVPPNTLLVPGAVVPAVAPNKVDPPDEVVSAGVMRLKSDILSGGVVCDYGSRGEEKRERRRREEVNGVVNRMVPK